MMRSATAFLPDSMCEHLRSYTAAEPLPKSDFVRARGFALVAVERGDRSAAVRDTLVALKAQGEGAELNTYLPAIDAAIARFS